MGVPLELIAAVNSNDALARAINDGRYARTQATPTASVSMDVQAPSNFERLVFEASGRDADVTRGFFETFGAEGGVDVGPVLLGAIRSEVSAFSVSEERTAQEIDHAWKAYGRVICPHTAVALAVARDQDLSKGPVVALSTAHPAKFPEFVSGVLGFDPEEPAAIRNIESRPERLTVIDADLGSARAAVAGLQAERAGA
jgi:threonine synthase